MINARGISGAEPLKPFQYVRIEPHSHQFLRRTPELAELLVSEGRNIGIVNLRNIGTLLPLCYAVQSRLLPLSQGLGPDRFGAHARQLPALR